MVEVAAMAAKAETESQTRRSRTTHRDAHRRKQEQTMGRNIPASRRQRLQWMEGLIDKWTVNQAAIGLSSATVTALTDRINTARAAFTASEELHLNARAATANYHDKADAAHALASDVVQTIKAFAQNSTEPGGVYVLAGLTPKAAPSPVEPPDRPVITGLSLNSNGSVTVAWEGSGPTGTNYLVRRRIAGERAFVIIGQSGPSTKRLTDTGVPAGTPSATYTVQAVRGDDASPQSVASVIQFGNIAVQGFAQASGPNRAA
jgi:hypothetical protein